MSFSMIASLGSIARDFAITWIPVLFFFLMIAVVYLLWRTVKMMPRVKPMDNEIGRASCRERVYSGV